MKPTRMIDPAMEVPHTAGEAVVEVAQMEMRPAPRNGRHPLLRYLFGRCHIDMPRRYTSARIENYLGFPTGISGIALMAGAYNQAQKFGVQLAIPDEAISLSAESVPKESRFLLRLANGEQAVARSVVIASGARYRRLALPQMDAIEATSVHYWASPLEAKLCAGQEIALVGAGNSAGQAVVYLASQVAKVWLLVRGASLATSMSSYLVDRIEGLANVEVILNAEVSGPEGEAGILETIRWRLRYSGEEVQRPIRHLLLFIGADPNTDWLDGSGVALDPKGFVLTGLDAGIDRKPLETSLPGVFAIGDVRSGSVKRVAAAGGKERRLLLRSMACWPKHDRLALPTFNAEPSVNMGGWL